MEATDITTTLEAMAKGATEALPNYTGSGDPIQRAVKTINGHMVHAVIIARKDAHYEVDHSTEVLTLAQAAARVEA